MRGLQGDSGLGLMLHGAIGEGGSGGSGGSGGRSGFTRGKGATLIPKAARRLTEERRYRSEQEVLARAPMALPSTLEVKVDGGSGREVKSHDQHELLDGSQGVGEGLERCMSTFTEVNLGMRTSGHLSQVSDVAAFE